MGLNIRIREETEYAWKVSIEEIKERNYNLDIKNPNKQEDEVGDPEELLELLKGAEIKAAELRDELKNSLMESTPSMNVEQLLFEHYDGVVDSPEASVKLRKFILDLAVRGRLVEQDPR